jgi:adenosylmethionine-8-amino-7-oxononanoate aminotransferase
LTTDEIYQAFYDDYELFKLFIHSHSYSANPLACAAANVTLDLLTVAGFMDSLKPKIEAMHEQGEILRDLPWCGEFRQTGMIAAVELVRNRETLEPFPIEQRVGHQIFLEGLKREVVLRPLGNVVYFIPPLVIEPDQIETMMNAADESITAVLKGI